MTSYTWRSNTDRIIIGCGVDAERIARFERFTDESPPPMPFVFTEGEIQHACAGSNAATRLCLCFTCKEALFKALGTPFDYTLCELLPHLDPGAGRFEGHLSLDVRLKASTGASDADVHALLHLVEGHVVSSITVYGREDK